MVSITLSVPEELKKKMDEFKIINWSEVAREAIKIRVAQLNLLKSITAKSKLTKEDALQLGRKINKSLHDKLAR